MNKILLTAALMVATACLHAQNNTTASKIFDRYQKVARLNAPARGSYQQRGTGTAQRLIGMTKLESNDFYGGMRQTDSTVYRYGSTERGSRYLLDFLNEPWSVDADHIAYYEFDTVASPYVWKTTDMNYDASNRVIFQVDSTRLGFQSSLATTYNAAGKPEHTINHYLTFYDSLDYTCYYFYSPTGKQVKDSFVNVTHSLSSPNVYTQWFINLYEYNAADQVTTLIYYNKDSSGLLSPNYRMRTTYDAQRRINAIFQDEPNMNGAFVNNTTDSFYYDGGSGTEVMQVSSYYSGALSYKLYRHNDASGRMSYSVSYQPYGRLEATDSVVYMYNSFNNPTTILDFGYDGLGEPMTFPKFRTNHYYEEHTLGISRPEAASTISLYPNPATDKVCISLAGVSTNTGIIYCITDINGRRVMQGYERTSGNRIVVNTADLAPGMYHVTVRIAAQATASAPFVKLY